MSKTFTIKKTALCALFTALCAVCSIITVPSPIPFTLQTFAITLAVYVLGIGGGMASVSAYIVLGAIGLPIFSGMHGGIGVLFGPTGGFILGFIPFCLIIGFALKKFKSLVPRLIGCFIGLIVLYICGAVQYIFVASVSFWGAVTVCVLPFIIPDVLKILLAVVIGNRINKVIK